MKSVKEVKRREYYIFSPFLRIFHWIMASQIVILFITGLLITKPMNVSTTEPFFTITSMDLVRDIHFTAAFILCASLILRVYGFRVNTILGSEMMTHYVHHYVAWFIILFAIGHLYMVIRAEFMEGESEVSSMFSGKKILAHTPKDANELA